MLVNPFRKKKSDVDAEYEKIEKEIGRDRINELRVIAFFEYNILKTPAYLEIIKRLEKLEREA